jgi:CPA2 family monovalent cation:H+ antiporter-2
LTAFHLLHNGYDHRTAYLAGMSLDQVSEFALVVAIQAYVVGQMGTPLFESVVLASAASMVASSYTNRHSSTVFKHLNRLGVESDSRRREELVDVDSLSGHVVVVGYGDKGSRVASQLEDAGVDVVAIDSDPERITSARHEIQNYVFGDAARRPVLEQARAGEAAVLISTVEGDSVSSALLEFEGGAEVVLSARGAGQAAELLERGATVVDYPGELEVDRLREHVQSALRDPNYPEELRRRKMLELRRRTRET